MPNSIDLLFSDLLQLQHQSSESLPPVQNWNPPMSGDMDLVIDREGRWIHEGVAIHRTELVNLFARILKREDNQYFLVTPVEKWRIKVDVAPLFVIAADREIRETVAAINMLTSTGDRFLVGCSNPLWFEHRENSGDPIPLVIVRDSLPALISRPVFYELCNWARIVSTASGDQLWLDSMGEQFLLGSVGCQSQEA